MVSEQISFFIKTHIFYVFCLDRETDFWINKNGTGTGSNRNRSEPEPTETEPNRTVGFLSLGHLKLSLVDVFKDQGRGRSNNGILKI